MLEVLTKETKTINGYRRTLCYCKCSYCGNEKWIRSESVVAGQQSCGCLNTGCFKTNDLTKLKFGRLTSLNPTSKRASNGSVIWKCVCDCGNMKEVPAANLVRGDIKSCGCLGKENSSASGKKVGEINVSKNVVSDTHIKLIENNNPLKNNKSGYKGVHLKTPRNKYVAQIQFQNKYYYLGQYDTAEEASKIYQEAKKNLHGEFLNWYKEQKEKGI